MSNPAPSAGHGRARTSQTLARGLAVLDCFLGDDVETLGVKDLAARLSLPQTNVARLVATLVEAGYLAQHPVTRQYRLGLRAYVLGLHANPADELRQAAQDVLVRLAQATGETVSLNVIDPVSLDGVCIASIDSPAQIKLTTRVGSVRPLYWGASRKVLLAFAADAEQKLVLDRAAADLSPAQQAALRAELQSICETGYASSEEELDNGAYAVAAPVWTQRGQLLAGVAVAGPLFRRTDDSYARFIGSVREAAAEIASRLSRGL